MTIADSFDAPLPSLAGPGPVTRSRLGRTYAVYTAICALGAAPWLLALSPAWQAAGLGLLFPGAGFLAVGGWALLLIPVALALFVVAMFAWLIMACLPAPLLVWFGSAALAGALAGDNVWSGAPHAAFGLVAATGLVGVKKARESRQRQLTRRKARAANASQAMASARAVAAPRPSADQRELSREDLAHVRYALDRALQPVGEYEGYDSPNRLLLMLLLKLQINSLGYALSAYHIHYTPNFHGYLSRAQRNLIETYLDKRVWDYWVLQTAWGQGNFTDFDPIRRDNIMMSGFFGSQVGMYQVATGDTRYSEPGSLTFRLNDRTAYAHDLHTINQALASNFKSNAFCLYACEPNWVYPYCNFRGMTSLVTYDQAFATAHAQEILPRWHESLANEFLDLAGNIISVRSSIFGFRPPKIPSADLVYPVMYHPLVPETAWALWADAREDVLPLLRQQDGKTVIGLSNSGVDPGNFRPGSLVNKAANIAFAAREFGDDALAEAAQNTLDLHGGRTEVDGVISYVNGSNIANSVAVLSRLLRRDDWKEATLSGPAACTRQGPLLEDADYPAVLVARAFSHGEDLELVLYSGDANPRQRLGLSRLKPGQTYLVSGATPARFTADNAGRGTLEVTLHNRTTVTVIPADSAN